LPGGWKRSSTAREEHTNVPDAAGRLVHGYATIYVAYHTNGGEKVFAYYADEKINKRQIQVIRLQAPFDGGVRFFFSKKINYEESKKSDLLRVSFFITIWRFT
jgi:hypothetical protein